MTLFGGASFYSHSYVMVFFGPNAGVSDIFGRERLGKWQEYLVDT